MSKNKKLEPQDIFVYNRRNGKREHSVKLRRALLECGVPHICFICKMESEWRGKPLKLDIDHKDGDRLNNKIDNLRFLCPNCHSQETYG